MPLAYLLVRLVSYRVGLSEEARTPTRSRAIRSGQLVLCEDVGAAAGDGTHEHAARTPRLSADIPELGHAPDKSPQQNGGAGSRLFG